MSLLSLLLYIPLQVLLIPMAILGVVLVAYNFDRVIEPVLGDVGSSCCSPTSTPTA